MSNPTTSKVAIVTGGSSGIGKETAIQLAQRGRDVLITGRDRQRLEQVASASDRLVAVRADMANPRTSHAGSCV